MTRRYGLFAAVALTALALWASNAHGQAETSIRGSVWTGDRTAVENDDPIVNLELWARNTWKINDDLSFHAEGWAATDAIGDGAYIDVREGHLRWRQDRFRVIAGRQVFAWGRMDRLNPTDVMGAKDMRRLTEEDGDQRLGIGAVTVQTDVAGGELSAIWAPEFRATELPQSLEGRGFEVRDDHPDDAASQFALRYERFDTTLDWSATYAEVFDWSPWLIVGAGSRPGVLALVSHHPKVRMLGGDIATTVGSFGVRVEAAIYDYVESNLHDAAYRKPTSALAIGLDRDLPGQININVQALVRTSEATNFLVPQEIGSRLNATLQYMWRDTVVGGLVRVRKLFDADRGSIEASVGGFNGGGEFQQIKFGYALADGIRLTALAERYSGGTGTLLGRLENNSLVTFGFRFGF